METQTYTVLPPSGYGVIVSDTSFHQGSLVSSHLNLSPLQPCFVVFFFCGLNLMFIILLSMWFGLYIYIIYNIFHLSTSNVLEVLDFYPYYLPLISSPLKFFLSLFSFLLSRAKGHPISSFETFNSLDFF